MPERLILCRTAGFEHQRSTAGWRGAHAVWPTQRLHDDAIFQTCSAPALTWNKIYADDNEKRLKAFQRQQDGGGFCPIPLFITYLIIMSCWNGSHRSQGRVREELGAHHIIMAGSLRQVSRTLSELDFTPLSDIRFSDVSLTFLRVTSGIRDSSRRVSLHTLYIKSII